MKLEEAKTLITDLFAAGYESTYVQENLEKILSTVIKDGYLEGYYEAIQVTNSEWP